MERVKLLGLSNSLQNLLFPPGKYTSAHLLNLSHYFISGARFTLPKYRQLMKQVLESQDQKIWWVVKAQYGQVDAKVLLLTLMLQLVGKQRRQVGGFNQSARNSSQVKQNIHNNLTSPRNRNQRAFYINGQENLILHYVKDNIGIFLRLLAADSSVEDPFIDQDQLQPLSFLFKVDKKKKFASYLPIFNNSNKLRSSTICEHLAPRIVISEQFRSVYLVQCTNCTIYIAACEQIAFLDKCQNVNFTIAANQLRICNTYESNIYYYGPAPIILTGDSRAVSIGPNNCQLSDMFEHLKTANIDPSKENVNNFQKVLQHRSSTGESSFSMMPLSEFDLLVLPNGIEQQGNNPRKDKQEKPEQKQLNFANMLVPQAYFAQLKGRNEYYSNLKSRIVQSNLSNDMIRHLHSALQGNFKQWMMAKRQDKNINDLVKMLDKK